MKKNTLFPFKKPEESTGFLLWQVSNMWHLSMKTALDPINLTFTQFSILAALQWLSDTNSESASEVMQQDIANHAKTDKMTTSKVLRTLQDKGFVNRQEADFDTRAKIVTITPQGSDILKQALPIVQQCDAHFFETVETQQAPFQEHLLRIYLKENDEKL